MEYKIKELAREAGFEQDKYGLYWDDDANNDGVDLDQFAVLIIKECMKVCEDVAERNEPAIACYDEIKRIFRS